MKNKRKIYQTKSDNQKDNIRNIKAIQHPSSLLKLQTTTPCESLPKIAKQYQRFELNKNRAMRSDTPLEKIKNKVKEELVTNRDMVDEKCVVICNNTNDVNLIRERKMGSKRSSEENKKQSIGKENIDNKVVKKEKNHEDTLNSNNELATMKTLFNVIHNKLKNVKHRSRGHRHTFDSLDSLDFEIGQSKENSKNYSELLKASSFLDKNHLTSNEVSPRKKILESRDIEVTEMIGNIGEEITKLERLHENSESRLRMCMNEQLDILDMQYYLKLLRNV